MGKILTEDQAFEQWVNTWDRSLYLQFQEQYRACIHELFTATKETKATDRVEEFAEVGMFGYRDFDANTYDLRAGPAGDGGENFGR